MNEIMLLALGAMALLLPVLAEECKPRLLFSAAGVDDDDVKIAAPGSYKAKKPSEDSELEAQLFLRMKYNGNIDRARQLGGKYASMLLEMSRELQQGRKKDDPLCEHQRIVLYSYAINRAISDLSPNSILAQTSLNVFYDEVETRSPELYRHISDMAAFSLYILCERSSTRSEEEIGRTYARLCDSEDDSTVAEEGNRLYRVFYDLCADELNNIEYCLRDQV